eukprot:Gb_25283 [translate_table: standard]
MTSAPPFQSSSLRHNDTRSFNNTKHMFFLVDAESNQQCRIPNATSASAIVRGQPAQKPKWQLRKNDYPFTLGSDMDTLCKEGRLNQALDILHSMDYRGSKDHINACASVLQACTNVKALREGKQVHTHMIITGLDKIVFLANKLVIMYVICGNLDNARLVFDKIHELNVFVWNTMISGYAKSGKYEEALKLHYQMRKANAQPDKFTFPFVLKACAGLLALREGKEIHCHIVRSQFELDVFVATALVDMYAKCGRVENARQVFDKMFTRDVVSWNALIAGYTQNGHDVEALAVFHQMQLGTVEPNSTTMVSVLPACAQLGALQQGKWIHSYIIRNDFESDISVVNALVAMYAKCGCIEIAHQVFDKIPHKSVVSWNIMIAHYARIGHANEALTLFHKMQLAGTKPDSVTMVSVLPACGHLADLEQGKWIHDCIIASGFDSDVSVGNSLVAMYSNCGNVAEACQVFDKIVNKSVVSWNAMIVGYTQNLLANEALTLFHQMQLSDVKPDSVTMLSVLPACAHLAALQQGKWIHGYVIRSGFESDVFVENALITMYAKCGTIEDARQLFGNMSKKTVASWNAMIAGYGMHGYCEAALTLFSEMQRTGMKPDDITFIGILSACSHAGLVNEGWHYFDCMSRDYCITPREEHYACMIDVLGRAGYLDEAYNFIKRMPLEPGTSVWGALFGACKLHCNVELGELVAERLIELEPENAGHYVLLSNIYAVAGRWDGVEKVRTMINDRGLKKSPECSWIEIKNRVHIFFAGDRSHPQSEKIYSTLESLAEKMEVAGYMPDTSCVLHDMEVEEKEYILWSHSEKLAIVFGLINTSSGTPIKITKNLRVCADCHNATKFISKIVMREIIVRDANRFHHFKDGLCSCGDYW